MARFYLTVIQAVLLYGADSWVLTQRDVQNLTTFHNRALRYMTGQHIRKVDDKVWHYPDHNELMKKCGMVGIEYYVEARRGTLKKYMENLNPKLWREAWTVKPPSKNPNMIMWWKQKVLSKNELKKIIREEEREKLINSVDT